jgi:hypothetical protein
MLSVLSGGENSVTRPMPVAFWVSACAISVVSIVELERAAHTMFTSFAGASSESSAPIAVT